MTPSTAASSLVTQLLEQSYEAHDGTTYSEEEIIDVMTTSGTQTNVVGYDAVRGVFKTLRGHVRPEQVKAEFLPAIEHFKTQVAP